MRDPNRRQRWVYGLPLGVVVDYERPDGTKAPLDLRDSAAVVESLQRQFAERRIPRVFIQHYPEAIGDADVCGMAVVTRDEALERWGLVQNVDAAVWFDCDFGWLNAAYDQGAIQQVSVGCELQRTDELGAYWEAYIYELSVVDLGHLTHQIRADEMRPVQMQSGAAMARLTLTQPAPPAHRPGGDMSGTNRAELGLNVERALEQHAATRAQLMELQSQIAAALADDDEAPADPPMVDEEEDTAEDEEGAAMAAQLAAARARITQLELADKVRKAEVAVDAELAARRVDLGTGDAAAKLRDALVNTSLRSPGDYRLMLEGLRTRPAPDTSSRSTYAQMNGARTTAGGELAEADIRAEMARLNLTGHGGYKAALISLREQGGGAA